MPAERLGRELRELRGQIEELKKQLHELRQQKPQLEMRRFRVQPDRRHPNGLEKRAPRGRRFEGKLRREEPRRNLQQREFRFEFPDGGKRRLNLRKGCPLNGRRDLRPELLRGLWRRFAPGRANLQRRAFRFDFPGGGKRWLKQGLKKGPPLGGLRELRRDSLRDLWKRFAPRQLPREFDFRGEGGKWFRRFQERPGRDRRAPPRCDRPRDHDDY